MKCLGILFHTSFGGIEKTAGNCLYFIIEVVGTSVEVMTYVKVTILCAAFMLMRSVHSDSVRAVLLSPPQIPAGLKGFLGIPEDS